jgi:casein kinase II subunit beta
MDLLTSTYVPDSSQDEDSSESGWIEWYVNLEGHKFLTEVPEDYIQDAFNLYGLKTKVSMFSEAIDLILTGGTPDDEDLQDDGFLEIYRASSELYALIHARYIQTTGGLSAIREKFISGDFGICPRVMCEKQKVIPIGTSDQIGISRIKIFCPKCQDIYIPKEKYANIDGANFGTSAPHLFLQTYPEFYPSINLAKYVPRVYGFKLHEKKQ